MERLVERLVFPLFFLTVIFGLAYWYWTTTPSYTISQIIVAVKNKDPHLFEKYVDIESITGRAIDDVINGPAKDAGLLGGGMDNMIGFGIVSLFKPEIAAIAKAQVLGFIESGSSSLSGPPKENSRLESKGASNAVNNSTGNSPAFFARRIKLTADLPAAESKAPPGAAEQGPKAPEGEPSPATIFGKRPKPRFLQDDSLKKYTKGLKISGKLKDYGLSKEGFKGIDYLKTDGPISHIGLKFHTTKLNRDFIIDLKMQDAGGYWRITELSNLNELIATYLEWRHEMDALDDGSEEKTPAKALSL